MSRRKPLTLAEARKSGKLKQFAKENDAIGDRDAFERLTEAMASGKKPAKAGTKDRGASGGSSGTRSRRGT